MWLFVLRFRAWAVARRSGRLFCWRFSAIFLGTSWLSSLWRSFTVTISYSSSLFIHLSNFFLFGSRRRFCNRWVTAALFSLNFLLKFLSLSSYFEKSYFCLICYLFTQFLKCENISYQWSTNQFDHFWLRLTYCFASILHILLTEQDCQFI